MQVEVKIDRSADEPRVIIVTKNVDEEISQLIRMISSSDSPVLTGFDEGNAVILQESDIYSFYSADKKVFAALENEELTMRLRMYELEDKLDGRMFARISNSEIINLKKVERFDLSMTGTICVKMTNGRVTYVSRRYVSKIKQILGV